MKKINLKKSVLVLLFSCSFFNFNVSAQEKKVKADTTGYVFTIVKQVKATPVKNQYRSGTCWSFSTISFIESELLRMRKEEYDLSEMFPVRYAYSEKAIKYVRMHGHINFAAGGEFHDVMDVIKKYGIVPEEVYPGLDYGTKKHIHGELDAVLKNYVDAVIENKNKKITPVWHNGFDDILDTYLGVVPKTFTYKGKEYSPKSFAKELGINPDDFVELTSFSHHPFYTKFILEVPDNWAWDNIYNVPLDKLEDIIDNAIDKGYSVAWGADVSEKGVSVKNGIAIVPEKDYYDMTKKERKHIFDKPGKEKQITQKLRQKAFDNWTTTDDHGLQITGIAKDQNGDEFYLVKNSWGSKIGNKKYKGYFYASKPYVLYKTIDIMVNKKAIPKKIRKKLGL